MLLLLLQPIAGPERGACPRQTRGSRQATAISSGLTENCTVFVNHVSHRHAVRAYWQC